MTTRGETGTHDAMLRVPRATYRLQLTASFGFREAQGLLDYLHALGVSDVYASPCLAAVRGSEHGYDVVDHGCVREELGGEAAFEALCRALAEREMGLLLDIVPNHMAVGTTDNALWRDVLENGPASEFAAYFDVDWDAAADNRVLLPVLGERYAAALESGALRIEREGARFVVRYHEHTFPAAPRSLAELLVPIARTAGGGLPADVSAELGFLADHLAGLADPWTADRPATRRRRRDLGVLFTRLEELLERQPALAARIDGELAELSKDPDRFDAWLERQNWKLSHWKAAATELGYRRFFDIQSLAGLRMEDPDVFEATHARILDWVRRGWVSGLRIDHPDGLRDPEGYLVRLRAAAPAAYVVVEKILEADEALPAEWPVQGTTGYDFARLVDQVQVDPSGEPALRALAQRAAGEPQDFEEMVIAARYEVLERLFGSERERVVQLGLRALGSRRALRDVTRSELRRAVTHVVARFHGYRSYVRAGQAAGREDERRITSAIERARAADPETDDRLWQGLEAALLLRPPYEHAGDFALAFQQLTGPVAAKAVEDTACYRHLRLLALNEVGGSPGTFGIPVAEFHAAMQARPGSHSMLASATHDTKRGEDVRARLIVLSEVAGEWARWAEPWLDRSDRHAGAPLDRGARYAFLQTLVGAFPLEAERAFRYVQKAAREAKRYTSWTAPDAAYEAALERYVRGVLGDDELMAEVETFVARIAPAGYVASLARTLVKLTAPGVPDIYQGNELWDLHLVDPDNRAPVDFERRRELLARAEALGPEDAMAGLDSGLSKLWLIRNTLALRASRPEAFDAPYVPLPVRGEGSDALLAYARGEELVVVVPRWPVRVAQGVDAQVQLPAGRFRSVFTGERVEENGSDVPVRSLLARFPVALLAREP